MRLLFSFTVSCRPNYRRTRVALAPGVPSLSCPSHCQKAPLPVHAHNNALACSNLFIPVRRPSGNIHLSGKLPRIVKIPTSLKPNLECCWNFLFAQNHFTGRCGLSKRQIIDYFCTTSHNVCICALCSLQRAAGAG